MERAIRRRLVSFIIGLALLWVERSSGQNTILYEGFEGAFPGSWLVGDADLSAAYWDDVSRFFYGFGTPYPRSGDWCGYCAGIGYGGTSANPRYQNYMGAYMARDFDLAGYGSASLTFWYIIPSIDAGYDSLRVFIDSTLVFERSSAVASWTPVTIDLTPYAGGTHSLEFDFNSDSLYVAEGAYLDDIRITGVTLPNLAPYRPNGWSDKIVVSKVTGTTADSNPLTAADTLYVDWAVINNGLTAVTASFTNELYVDGVLRHTWPASPPQNPGDYVSAQDFSIGQLNVGTHTVKIKTDAGGNVSESDGADNEYTKTVIVGAYSISTQWEGMSVDESNFIPPDPHGAVGPGGVVQTVNTLIAYYLKTGARLWGPTDLSVFWSSVGNTGSKLSDPKALYDPASARFYVIMQEHTASQSFLNVAVSRDNNPLSSETTDWFFYRFDITESSGGINYSGDYPGVGIDAQALYVTYNMYALPNLSGAPKNTQIIILNKAALGSGTATPLKLFTAGASAAFALQPATVLLGNPGNVAYFVETLLNSQTIVRLWAVSDPLGAASLSAAFVTIPSNGGSTDSAPQLGTSILLDTASPRTQGNAFWYKGAIWFCHTAGGASGRAKVYYYKLASNNFPAGTPTLLESGSIDGGAGIWTYQPAIGGNIQGDVCLVYMQSSASMYPTIMFTARAPGAASFAAPSALKASLDFYNGSSSFQNEARWGDFATVSADPSDGTFWITHEWSRSSKTEDWGTWWGRLNVITPPDPTPPTVVIASPTSGQRWSNSVFTVTGTASDNLQVAAVYYRLFGQGWNLATTANNWSNWSGNITLSAPGTNMVEAYSVDISSNSSPISGRSLVYVVTALITVQTNGNGTVSPNYNGQFLELGKSFSMTATAALGFAFTNWTGSVPTNGPIVQFLMASNLVLRANFVDITRPTVSMTNVAKTYTNSQTVTLGATAADNVGVASVGFYDGATLKGTTSAAPFSYFWSFTPIDNGAHTWTARAYDTAGNAATSSAVALTVSIDITPPTVAITTPTNGQVLTSAALTVTGTAADPGSPASGLAFVQVRLNGGIWTNATGTTSWNRPVTLTNCGNTIEARSRDIAGSYSAIVSNYVLYTPPNTVPNTPTNVAPGNRATNVTVTPILQASAFSDADPVCLGDVHAASQWQVLTAAAALVADSGTDTVNKVSWTVPANRLYYGSNYQWHVRYRDSRDGWSGYSVLTFFTNGGPMLMGTRQNTNIVFNWPTNAPGFALQWSTNLGFAIWSNATPTQVIVSGQYAVTNNMSNRFKYYRLKK